jgi:glycosyltransferase involved in cell wall biosynthesis
MATTASCSVIIPCYNSGRFLRETLQSLVDQTCHPDEIIVVDDGSTDDSAAIAEGWSSSVRVIRQANQGESVARNVGLKAARGRYVLFLDADDLLAPESIERLDAAVSTAVDAVAVMGTCFFNEDALRPFDRHMPAVSDFFPTILQTNFGPPHCWYTPRELALSVGGFREDLVNSEDWEFWGRIALAGGRLVSIPYAGALYRRHPGSQVATTSQAAIFRGRLTVAETLAVGVLARPDLLVRTGAPLFWSLWAMLSQARRGGVPSTELRQAEQLLREIARRGPPAVRRSTFGKAVRYLGVRNAERLRALVSRSART